MSKQQNPIEKKKKSVKVDYTAKMPRITLTLKGLVSKNK